jgi:hypothetical protein
MKKHNKELMVAVGISLSKPEAIGFAQSLDKNDKWYMVKIPENPKARHIARRERYVVVRYPHNREAVKNGNALFEVSVLARETTTWRTQS